MRQLDEARRQIDEMAQRMEAETALIHREFVEANGLGEKVGHD
jgi:hypothetical protein